MFRGRELLTSTPPKMQKCWQSLRSMGCSVRLSPSTVIARLPKLLASPSVRSSANNTAHQRAANAGTGAGAPQTPTHGVINTAGTSGSHQSSSSETRLEQHGDGSYSSGHSRSAWLGRAGAAAAGIAAASALGYHYLHQRQPAMADAPPAPGMVMRTVFDMYQRTYRAQELTFDSFGSIDIHSVDLQDTWCLNCSLRKSTCGITSQARSPS